MVTQQPIPKRLDDEHKSFSTAFWQLYIDGASRNNPGVAGAGVCIKRNKEIAIERSFYLGLKTNNQAEYLALLLGLFLLLPELQEGDTFEIVSDSELLVRQMNGLYRVKSPDLQLMHKTAQEILKPLRDYYTVRHVLRSDNQDADKLANVAINKKVEIPLNFLEQLKEYGITI